MDFHPSKLPIIKVFDIKDETAASEAVDEIVKIGFGGNGAFKVLMPKEQRLAKRIGYTVTTGINVGLRKTNQDRNIQYWTYLEGKNNYAIVLIGPKSLKELGF